jgi:deoxyribonuclease V
LLCGSHRPLDSAKGGAQPIKYQNAEVGLAYRSKDGVKPIYISPGHLCDLAVARDLVVRCLRGYRLPEPLRAAHLRANKHKRYIES